MAVGAHIVLTGMGPLCLSVDGLLDVALTPGEIARTARVLRGRGGMLRVPRS